MLQVFLSGRCVCSNRFQVFLGVFASVSDACFKCFICLLLYIINVASECFRSIMVLHMGCAWKVGRGHAVFTRGGDAGDV
jgi:hypothetical protein